jgi:hypothetical protein
MKGRGMLLHDCIAQQFAVAVAVCAQVTRRWLNFEGIAVPSHLAQQLKLMDELIMQQSVSDGIQGTHQAPTVSPTFSDTVDVASTARDQSSDSAVSGE